MSRWIQPTLPFVESLSLFEDSLCSDSKAEENWNWKKRKSTIGLLRCDLTRHLRKTEDGFPIVKAYVGDFPAALIGIERINGQVDKRVWLHGFSEDCNLERIWKNPMRYVDRTRALGGMISPDYSMYLQMTPIEKRMNVFRKNAISQIFQNNGINVIHTLCWAESSSLDYCVEGVEKHGIYAVSNIGVYNNYVSRKLFRVGLQEIVRVLEPKGLIIYGYPLDSTIDCDVRHYENQNLKRLHLLNRRNK